MARISRVLGIEIGYSYTRVAETDFKSKNTRVYQCFTFPTPSGTLVDGHIQKPEELAMELRKELRAHGIKTRNAVYTITSPKIASREVNIPYVKQNQIYSLVEMNAADYFPVELENHQLAYSILGEVKNEQSDARQYRLLVLAAPNDLLESYYDLSKRAGLVVAALDYQGNSVVPILKTVCGKKRAFAVKVEVHSTLMTVIKDGEVSLQRSINLGIEPAIDAVREFDVFGTDHTFESAVKKLRENQCIANTSAPQGGPGMGGAQGGPFPQGSGNYSGGPAPQGGYNAGWGMGQPGYAQQPYGGYGQQGYTPEQMYRIAVDQVTESISELIGTIARTLDYYNSRNTGAEIEEIYLMGMGAEFKGLASLIAEAVGQNVQILNYAGAINLSAAQKKGQFIASEFVATIGCAIAPLDMIPDSRRAKKRGTAGALSPEDRQFRTMMIAGIGFMLLALALVASAFLTYLPVRVENQELNAEVNRLKPIVEVYNAYVEQEGLYKEILEMAKYTRTRNEGLLAFVEEMEDKIPSTSYITSFSSDGSTVTMSFVTDSKEAAMNIVNCLRTFETIESMSITGISEAISDSGAKEDSFSITLTYKSFEKQDAEEAAEAEAAEAAEEALGDESSEGDVTEAEVGAVPADGSMDESADDGISADSAEESGEGEGSESVSDDGGADAGPVDED